LFQEELINDIELLRSNKLSANAKVKNLEKQIADERTQLEKRGALIKELNDQNIKVQNEEFAIFQKGVAEKIDVQKLLAIQDEVQLKNFVRKNIASIEGTALETELFKIIKQSQEAQISNEEKLKKLEDDKLKRLLAIKEIEREINILILQDQANDIQKIIDERTSAYEKSTDKILNYLPPLQ